MQCPNCKTESDGRFCPSCGTPLKGATCRVCAAPLLAGAAYCTKCGEAVHAKAGANLPWYLAGAAILTLIVVLIMPAIRGEMRAPVTGGGTAPMASSDGTGAPPPLTGTPREQADRLFNRIMQEREAGNLDRATFFLPMAISAYQQAGDLDADGLYHLSILQAAAGDFTGALASAQRILGPAPDHLLGLAAAAEAATEAGDSATARQHWSRFLQVYDTEKDKPLQEYLDHGRILPEYRTTAAAAVGG